MSWKDTLNKGKLIDSLVAWWKNRKFRNAARNFLKTQVDFAMQGDYGNWTYVHRPEKMAEDKEEFLKIMGEIFEEEYPKLGRSAASNISVNELSWEE